MSDSTRPRSDSHVGRVFGLLDLLGEELGELTLSELARRAGLPVSTTHRLLGELTAWGGVERTPDGAYRLGEKVWRLGMASAWERRLREAALPHARALAGATGNAVAVSTMVQDRLICLDTVRGRAENIYLAHAGDEIPLFATSAGKLLMSGAEPATVSAALRTRLERRTPYTQIQPRLVLAQLENARRAGFAVTHSESTAGQSSVSVPVAVRDGQSPIALTVLTPSTVDGLTKLVPVMRRYAASISQAMRNVG
ncbi:IclR family transcriptional regulator [Kutzneria sp. CA-103260]|uniref:IclR family transcriptional regulator n=1 Tax=Kutzneria sp. CA-103260 TaxID=2802641 RepID=UPI001BAC0B5E|nr:IclR family transcriptional regulator [Kutzneria sp. CA-103260]QUQ64002.1 regulatory protein [Kutzneria sp. CA-103260]